MITLILFICSVGLVELNDFYVNSTKGIDYGDDLEYVQSQYELLSQKENKSLEEEYQLYDFKVRKEIYQYLKDKNVKSRDWKAELIHGQFLRLLDEHYILKLFLEHREDDDVQAICKLDKTYWENSFEATINHYCKKTDVELETEYDQNEKEIALYSELLKEDKFYLYVQYSNNYFEDEEMYKLVVNHKIESMEDFKALNYMQYPFAIYEELKSEEDFNRGAANDWFSTYQDYIRYETKHIKDEKAEQAIILYSTKYNIKHDLVFDDTYYDSGATMYSYVTGKTAVNLIFHFSLIVILLVGVTSGGIISKEHSSGTIKNLITAPIKRWKILLSKFIYLILHMYIIWLLALVVLSLYAGIRYGFGDLLSPKLVYWNGKVVEVNYYLYLLKDMFLASIPVIACLSILFFLSTITLNTPVATSVTTIFGILPLILWYLCSNMSSIFLPLTKTPFLYFDCGFIFGKQEFYMDLLKKTDINLNYGIIVSLITIVIFYGISNIVYLRRDIKN